MKEVPDFIKKIYCRVHKIGHFLLKDLKPIHNFRRYFCKVHFMSLPATRLFRLYFHCLKTIICVDIDIFDLDQYNFK